MRVIKDKLGDHADDVLREIGLEDYIDDVADKVDDVIDAGDGLIDDAVGALCSFSADTLVSTPYGFAAISELEAGKYVLAYDEATGTLIYAPILATWVHDDPIIVHLTIDGELLKTTPGHPFRLANGDWITAANLQTGDQIQQAYGLNGTVETTRFIYATQPMYNLTIATAHTFFVGEGQWLVHNKCAFRFQKLGGFTEDVLSKGFHLNSDIGELTLTPRVFQNGKIEIAVAQWGPTYGNLTNRVLSDFDKFLRNGRNRNKAIEAAQSIITRFGDNPQYAQKVAEAQLLVEAFTTGSYSLVK